MSKAICKVLNCPSDASRRGWCNKHYLRWYRHGSPEKVHQEKFSSPEELFRNRTSKEGDCLVWIGATYGDSRGMMRVRGERMLAYRYAWEVANGPIPTGMTIDHTCFNPSCVKLSHLRLATVSENNQHLNGPRKNNLSTGVRNVYKDGDKYRVEVRKNGVRYNFGSHSSIEEASEVAEKARQELFGEFAGLGLHSDITPREAVQEMERAA